MTHMAQLDILRQECSIPVAGEYDIIVVGGGIAGCAAALAAARKGSSVLLLEKMTMLGGLATAGHVVIYLPLCDGYGHQVCAGIAEEFLHLSVKYSYTDNVTTWKEAGRRYETRFNGPAYALALEEILLSEKVEILYDTLFTGSVVEDGSVTAVIVENKSGRQAYRCKAVIDASGDAEVLKRMGKPCAAAENSLAIWCYASGAGSTHTLKRGGAEERGLYLVSLGNIDTKAAKHIVVEPYFGDSAKGVNRFIIDGHKRLLGCVKEDADLTLASLPSMAQFRMAQRIEGAYVMSDADSGKHFEDNIGGVGDWRRPAPVYEIPYRALYVEGVKNVLAAGRCISAKDEAWEITRVIPAAAVTGEAAGAAAVMAVQHGVAVEDLSVEQLRSMLADDGVILDVNEGR